MNDDLALLRTMMLVREFEAVLVARPDHGFQLLSSGQEAVAAGLCSVLADDDRLFCSGRSIAPALARGLDPGEVMAELLGRERGTNRGRAGRGHISQPRRGFFGAHAVVAGNLSIAAGAALALKLGGHKGVVACIFGDGACGSGALHEALNLSAAWRLPLLFVCDNNGYSVSTRREDAIAVRRLSDLAQPFGIPAETVDGMDARIVRLAAGNLLRRVREECAPAFLECRSERFFPHSTSTRETRPPAELAAARARCPIARLQRELLGESAVDPASLDGMRAEVGAAVASAVAFAEASPPSSAQEVMTDVE